MGILSSLFGERSEAAAKVQASTEASNLQSDQGSALKVEKVEKTDAEWRKELSRREYGILRGKGTERAGSGQYNKFYPSEGHFVCAACSLPLYSAQAKFDSGCGWPAFDKCYSNAIKTKTDYSLGGRRTEIMCNACDGHLGHVFHGERFTQTSERHCVNSVSVKYVEANLAAVEAPLNAK